MEWPTDKNGDKLPPQGKVDQIDQDFLTDMYYATVISLGDDRRARPQQVQLWTRDEILAHPLLADVVEIVNDCPRRYDLAQILRLVYKIRTGWISLSK